MLLCEPLLRQGMPAEREPHGQRGKQRADSREEHTDFHDLSSTLSI